MFTGGYNYCRKRGFIVNILKDSELKSKDAIIESLTKQLLSSNSKKSQMKSNKCNLNETFNGDKSFYDNKNSDESNMDKDKTIEQKGGYYRRFYV